MRILLINSNRYKDPLPVIPIGLCYIAGAIEKNNYKVSLLDLCFSKHPKLKIKKKIKKFKPDIIGISIRNIDTCNGNSDFLLDDVKKNIINPCKEFFQGPIVIGGASVGINGEEMLKYFDLEYAIQGDGENSFLEFISRYKENKKVTGIRGLIIMKNGRIIENNSPDFKKDLNSLYPINPKKYINLFLYRLFDSPIQVQSKRGCELKCTYCTYNRLEGDKYRLIDPRIIADEIEYIVKKTGIRHIEFADSTFNIPLEHAKKVLKALITKKLKLKITTMGLNPKCIDSEFADLLIKSNFIDASVTIESCSNEILKNLNKNYTRNDILKACLILKEKKIPIQWYLILGAPGETEETIKETFKTLEENFSKYDMVIVSVGLRIYNGSRLAQELFKKNKNITDDSFFKPIAFIPDKISLRKIKTMALLESFKNLSLYLIYKNVHIPFFFIIFRIIFKILFPREPYWRLYIRSRLFFKKIGLQKLWLPKKNKNIDAL